MRSTLPETSIGPENGWLEDYFPFGKVTFQGYVKLQMGICNFNHLFR